jgi:hypothetical protein
LTLRSKVKVSRRSFRYVTYRLMVMHPYLNDTIKKTIIWPWGQSPTKVIMVCDTPPYGHAPTYQISLIYLERQKYYGPDKKILFKKTIIWPCPWGQSSRSHEGHYGMRHTALWSCTHVLEWYYLKNNYLMLRSKVKVPWRSSW